MGYLLIAISAALFAALLFQAGDERSSTASPQLRRFRTRKLWRRTVANTLLAIVGIALILFEQVPQTPLAITAYLLFLVLATVWIMALGCADWNASRRFHYDQELDDLATNFRRAKVTQDQVESDAPQNS